GDALLSELPALDFTAYKLIVFASTSVLNATQRRLIKEKVAESGCQVVLWGYAAWGDGAQVGAEIAGAGSGFATSLRHLENPVQSLDIDGAKEELALGRPVDVPAYDAAEDHVIGRWADGSPSAVWREAGGTTWWTF